MKKRENYRNHDFRPITCFDSEINTKEVGKSGIRIEAEYNSMLKSGQLLYNNLDKISSKYGFEFCVVDMKEIEKRINSEFDLAQEMPIDVGLALSNAEKAHLYSIKLQKNRIQWIAGRYAVKSALFKYKLLSGSFMDLSCIDILKGADSAPYIPQYPNITVSITHSFPYCIGIVSERKIGVDIENIFMPDDSLIQYFYTDNEKAVLKDKCCLKDYSEKAVIFWTRKEAVSKLLKLGMQLNFKKLDTSSDSIFLNYENGINVKLISFCCDCFCASLAVEIF
ncbi:MAG: 4'-phosphopantetheinyl transferase superfamily protein [Bacillota bacterium]|nr:4'-phosphopantetheinyl transferase superfamily protein [Bacillota bacterium]